MPFLSVIIPTYNRCKFLDDAIKSIYANIIDEDLFELIVIDNNSTDDTSKIANNYLHHKKNFRYQIEINNGLVFARHKGMQVSNGDVLLYLDDDVILGQQTLKKYIDIFKNDSQIYIAGGNILPRWEYEVPNWVESLWKSSQYGRYLSEYSLIQFNCSKGYVEHGFFYGCNFAIRKSYLLSSGGFHPDGFSKDKILWRGDGEMHLTKNINELGGKMYFDPEACLEHRISKERLTIEYLLERSFAQGISYSYAILKQNFKNSLLKLVLLNLKVKLSLFRSLLIRKKIFRSMRIRFLEGWSFHLNEYRRNIKLREWVHQKSYLEKIDK